MQKSMNWLKRTAVAVAVMVTVVAFPLHAGLSAQSYMAQESLVNQWDGIENVGIGLAHDSSAKVWKDLRGDIDLTLTSSGSWGDNCLAYTGGAAKGTKATAAYKTIELVYQVTEKRYGIIFRSGIGSRWAVYDKNGASLYFVAGSSTPSVPIEFNANEVLCVSALYDGNAVSDIYTNGVRAATGSYSEGWGMGDGSVVMLGGRRADRGDQYYTVGKIFAVRLYDRVLSAEELAANAKIDRARFCGVAATDMLTVVSNDPVVKEPSTSGTYVDLADGATKNLSVSAVWTNDAQTIGATCTGWKLLDADGVQVDEGTGNVCAYTHPTPAAYRELVWQWNSSYLVSAAVPAFYADHVTVAPAWVGRGNDAELSVVCDSSCSVSGVSAGRYEDGKVILENVTGPVTVELSFEPIVYVKPNGDDANDGSGWANAKRSVAAAVAAAGELAASSGNPVRVLCAEGVYLFATSVTMPDKVSIFGGYVIADGSRDTVNHPTIFCGDTNGDDVWSRKVIYGTLGARRGDAVPVVLNGRINVLPVEGCERMTLDTNKMTDNCMRCLVLGKGANTIDGITITGFSQKGTIGDTTANGTMIFVGGNCLATVNDVRCVGNYFGEGGLRNDGANGCVFSNCVLEWNACGRGCFEAHGGTGTLTGCTLRGNTGGGHAMVYLWGGGAMTITNCWFELGASGGGGQYSPAGAIAAESASSPTITHCVFTNNWCTGADSSSAITIQNIGSYRIENCLFTHNRTVASGLGNKSVAAGPINVRARHGGYVANCSFVSNTVEIASTTADVLLTAAPIAVYSTSDTGADAQKFEVVNCTFDGNGVTATNVKASATLVTASAIALYGRSNEGAAQIGVAGSTFSAEPGLPAIRSYGFNPAAPASHVVNSVFAANDVAPVSAPNGQPIAVEKCVLGAHFDFDPSISFTDCTEDDPLLRPLEVGPVLPLRRVGARLPDLCDTYDVAKNANSVNFFFLKDDQWERLVDNNAAASSPAAIPDAAGQTRPTGGAAMRGAVEGLPADVAAANTVVFRATPAEAGSLSGARTQLVGDGGTASAITATAGSDAIQFQGWAYSPDGTPFSTDATLSLTDVSDDAVVYAVFSTPKVSYTFTLGDCGTFDENGKGSISVVYDIGDTPSIPAYILDEEHYVIKGWDKQLPAKVGTEGITFTMAYDEKIYRIVRYDSAAEDGGDGESWATAMNDLQAALDKAAIWKGEVWIKKGIHKPTAASYRLRANVRVRGGFAGTEGETDADCDPVGNVTILSGDTDGKDYWRVQTVRGASWTTLKEEDGTTNLKVVADDGTVRLPDESKDYYRWLYTVNGSNKANLFKNDDAFDALDEACTVEGLTVVGYTGDNIYLAASAHAMVTNCTFVGTGCKIDLVSWATAVDCRFQGGGTGIYTASTGPWTKNAHIERCLFTDWSGGQRGVLAMQGGKADVIGCRFTRNEITSNGYGPGAAIGAEGGTAYIYGCLFENNHSTGTSGGWITKAAIMSNCVVRCNTSDGGNVIHVNTGKVFDSSFYSNVVTVTATAAKEYGASLFGVNTDRCSYFNCTFADNTAVLTPFEGATASMAMVKVSGNTYGGFLNCTFKNNSAPTAEFWNSAISRDSGRPTMIVNCLFANDDPDYVPVMTKDPPTTSNGGVFIYDSTIQNFSAEEQAKVRSVVRVDTNAVALARGRFNEFGQLAYPVKGVEHRNGTDVMVGANGVVVFNAAAKGETPSWQYKFASDGNYTGTLSPIGDIFGAPRPQGKMARGSTQLTAGSFFLILR